MSKYTTFSIYAITCIPTKQIYIGLSRNVASRKRSHFRALEKGNHKNSLLQAAYNKHGRKNFRFEIIESGIHPKSVQVHERFWIKYYFSSLIGFNQSEGGEANFENVVTSELDNDPNPILRPIKEMDLGGGGYGWLVDTSEYGYLAPNEMFMADDEDEPY